MTTSATELDELLARVGKGIWVLIDERNRLHDALKDVLDIAEEREDVRDGADGQPRPDAWMQVTMRCREALGR